ncbi:MAG: AGE family epimerase/isomerase [Candidatus Heimdallarchaeota archaeon]
MAKYRFPNFVVVCCLLLIITCNHAFIRVLTLDTNHERQNYLGTTNPDTFPLSREETSAHYADYTIAMLEFLLSHLWDSDKRLFFSEVERTGSVTSLAEYFALEQAMCINSLSYMYTKVENQTLRDLILDRITGAADSLIRDFWDEDGAFLFVAYPQLHHPRTWRKYALYQSIAFSAMITAHRLSGEGTYLSKAKMAVDFMLQQLWDALYGGFYFSDLNGTIDTIKDTQSQAMAISALISAFDQFGTKIYLERARQTVDFALTHLWDRNNNGFYAYSTANGTIPHSERVKRIVTQALMISALSDMYRKFNDSLYLDYINNTISFSMNHLWDPSNGGFFAYSSEDGLTIDETHSKATSKQFYMILALLETFEIYRGLSQSSKVPWALEYSNYLFGIILGTLEFVLRLWDMDYGGFYSAQCMMGEMQNTNKYAISQALGMEVLLKTLDVGLPIVTNFRWDPISPTPIDRITTSVSVFGLSPIEAVVLRYYLNDNMIILSIPMEASNQADYLYEAQIGPFPHGTLVSFAVWVNNSVGDEYFGKSYSLLVTEDRMGPAVFIHEVNPPTPRASEPIEITVVAVDDRPHISVDRVTISYRIDESEWEALELSQIDGNLFDITIGPFPGGSSVELYFTAYDSFGNARVTEVMFLDVPPEQRTIGGFEGIITIIALACWLSVRYYVSSRQNPRTKKQRI